MTAAELLKINKNSVELMSKIGLRTGDYRFLSMHEEYLDLKSKGEKVIYIIASLAERYKVSESSVKRIIRRLSREVIF